MTPSYLIIIKMQRLLQGICIILKSFHSIRNEIWITNWWYGTFSMCIWWHCRFMRLLFYFHLISAQGIRNYIWSGCGLPKLINKNQKAHGSCFTTLFEQIGFITRGRFIAFHLLVKMYIYGALWSPGCIAIIWTGISDKQRNY